MIYTTLERQRQSLRRSNLHSEVEFKIIFGVGFSCSCGMWSTSFTPHGEGEVHSPPCPQEHNRWISSEELDAGPESKRGGLGADVSLCVFRFCCSSMGDQAYPKSVLECSIFTRVKMSIKIQIANVQFQLTSQKCERLRSNTLLLPRSHTRRKIIYRVIYGIIDKRRMTNPSKNIKK